MAHSWNLSLSGTDDHQISFYSSFGRPIAKVFLGALFTYQALYWLWVKLETEEVKREKQDEIDRLEGELQRGLKSSSK
ncbi:MAG: hypothetical protein M1817_001571 [Caeruleum heppii]|nr:MAG: hypothetical protein M1817_001571 [Caeruleum heppii]